MARPKKPPGEAKEKVLQVRIRPTEHCAYCDAAKLEGKQLSEWIRTILNQAASDKTATRKHSK